MKLKFIIDKDYDIKMAKTFGLSKEKISEINYLYEINLEELELTKKLYQKSWDEINIAFSDYIEKETGYKWFYSEYLCVLSVVHKGISNWGHAPIIVRAWKEDSYKMRRITAHELILSHYFEIYRRFYSKEGLKDGQIWALAEIAAFALTSLTEEIKKFWPKNTRYYTNHNYPHIVILQNDLKEIFIKRKNFDEYIQKGIELVKLYPDMNPKGIK